VKTPKGYSMCNCCLCRLKRILHILVIAMSLGLSACGGGGGGEATTPPPTGGGGNPPPPEPPPPIITTEKVVFFVAKQSTYNDLGNEIDRFMNDVAADTGSTSKLTIINSNEKPSELRERLRSEKDLWGAFFIGDVPSISLRNELATNLSDHYYRSLDCPYTSTNDPSIVNGKDYFSIIVVCLPDIWVSRILATKSGSDGIEQIRTYLDKNNSTRNMPGNWNGRMWFGSATPREDTLDYASELSQIFASHPLYGVSDVDVMQLNDPGTQKAEFVSALQRNFDLVKLNVHGAATFVQFQGPNSGNFVNMSSSEARATSVGPKIVEMESCGIGNYSVRRNFASELLTTGDSLLVVANPEETFYSERTITTEMSFKYKPYGMGFSHAEMYTQLYQGSPRHFIGDPTIPLRNKRVSANAPAMSFNGMHYGEPAEFSLDFGKAVPGSMNNLNVVIENLGSETLVIEGLWFNDVADADDVGLRGTNGFVFSIDGFAGVSLNPYVTWEILPGETKVLPFLFDPGANIDSVPSGATYSGMFYFRTNDPNIGAFKIRTTGVTTS